MQYDSASIKANTFLHTASFKWNAQPSYKMTSDLDGFKGSLDKLQKKKKVGINLYLIAYTTLELQTTDLQY